jgi:tRNA threonylcarbamoyl adenosine modification protein YjeE
MAKRHFKAQIIAQLSLLSAVAYALAMLEFPLFPAAPFLKLSFANVPALIAGFAFGPFAAAVVTFVHQTLFFLSGTSTAPGLGELANLIVGLSYTLVAAFIYMGKKTRKRAVLALAVSSVVMVFVACLANLFMLLPMYGIPKDARMGMIWTVILPFNAIKAASTSIITFLLYKPLSRFLHLFDEVKAKKAFASVSVGQTEQFAFDLAKKAKGGEVYLLNGEMGAGKTVFAKGFARGLGVADNVTSPTFAIHNIYKGGLTLHHFDFYRLDEKEAEQLGLDEFFGDKNAVCLIEWGENIKPLIPSDAKKISIEVVDETRRTLEIR